MTKSPIAEYLEADHLRLHELWSAATATAEAVEPVAYEGFRAGLLRHIGIEEKILLPAAQRANGGRSIEGAQRLRRDHGVLAALMVPTPTAVILDAVASLLSRHNRFEGAAGGVYQHAAELITAAGGAETLAERMRLAPPVPTMPHFDGPLMLARLPALLRAALEAT